MRILSIETSCDETAIAIAEFSGPQKSPKIKILSNIVSSQVKLHAKFGGVVPNLAKREHQKNLPLVLLRALKEGRFSISKPQFLISNQIQKSLPGRQAGKVQKIEKILGREAELLKQFKKRIVPLAPPKLDAIAVTYGPGLAPALWAGVNFARALAYLWGTPLIPVNHMAGHLYSALLQASPRHSERSEESNRSFGLRPQDDRGQYDIVNVSFPALALLVSGGHTELVLMRGHGKFKILGETLDDAAGEAFDKVARILGLGYPGGPALSALAERSNQLLVTSNKIKLPRPMLNSKDYNFSFSGLKTAVLYLTRDLGLQKTKKLRPLIAKEFQDAVVEVLVSKTIRAAKEYKAKTILLGGGVAANKLLRERLVDTLKKGMPLALCYLPLASLTGDNALMIAVTARFTGKKKALDKVGADANVKLGD
ncbi:MAG: tRNA (adenosine(37)-N6)-threonylcarbamoyltransferase complex transferase subunit TsaD [Candidatus Sungbacteria bacterium]|nr:tRNA (adenosine(37)-N6)-threonylcarbamoyltransferase complex transferase subunit TsaD [Candidatus Sungbacteria bacterium]